MRPVPLSPGPPADNEGKIRWLIDRVSDICRASQVDSPVDVASELAGAYQPLDTDLTSISGLATQSFGRSLLVYASEATFKAGVNLEANADFYAPGGTDVPVVDGGTGASTPAGARTNLELAPTLGLEISAPNIQMTSNQRASAAVWIIDGGGAPITTGLKHGLRVPFSCTINSVTLGIDQTGSIVVDIWKDTHANFPPTVADTITASAKPTISSAVAYEDATLTGWTTAVTAGDWLFFNVDSVTAATFCAVVLNVTKT